MTDLARTIDLLSPDNVGEEKIRILLRNETTLRAFQSITVDFNYDDVEINGLIPPLEFIVQPTFGLGGESSGYLYKQFTRDAPSEFTFDVPSAGIYLVVLREAWHNRYWGRLEITVEGDPLITETTSTRR